MKGIGFTFYGKMQEIANKYNVSTFSSNFIWLKYRNSQKVFKLSLLANIKSELLLAFLLKFFQLQNIRNSGKKFHAINVFVPKIIYLFSF